MTNGAAALFMRTAYQTTDIYLGDTLLVADRMDITGARWSVNRAEPVLEPRAVRANDDFDEYWNFHLNNERHRTHQTRYAAETVPIAA